MISALNVKELIIPGSHIISYNWYRTGSYKKKKMITRSMSRHVSDFENYVNLLDVFWFFVV